MPIGRPGTLACLAVLGFLLAGCSQPPAAPVDDAVPAAEALGLEATATTGVIRGVVVDEAVRPLGNVSIALVGTPAKETRTGDDGAFGFDGLEPGTYFLKATRFGYFDVQQSADVVAGVGNPPAVKVQMARDTSAVAYVSAQKVDGYIVCTTSVVALCGAPNVVSTVLLCPVFGVCLGNLTDDRFGLNVFYEPNATWIQSEMFWDSTQSLSTELALEMENIGDCEAPSDSYIEDVRGNSPIYNTLDESEVALGTIGGTCPIFHSVFSGGAAETPPTPLTGPIALGVTVQQRFSIISHGFYGFVPPEGWRFSVDGTAPTPPS